MVLKIALKIDVTVHIYICIYRYTHMCVYVYMYGCIVVITWDLENLASYVCILNLRAVITIKYQVFDLQLVLAHAKVIVSWIRGFQICVCGAMKKPVNFPFSVEYIRKKPTRLDLIYLK